MQRLKQALRPRLWRYLARKQPPGPQILLRQSYLFVLPTRFGIGVLALVVLLYVLGTNYQNNLILLLAYALLVLCISCIVLAFQNLHHLVVSVSPPADVFAGDVLQVRINAERPRQAPVSVELRWDQHAGTSQLRDGMAELPLATSHRGCFALPWLQLQSVYPFGLVRCWSYVRPEPSYWVFPAPRQRAGTTTARPLQPSDSRDEWAGQRAMQPGDSPRQVDWKRFSRQQALTVHQYQSNPPVSNELWLTPDPALADLEQQLSDLCTRALQLSAQQQAFGLRLFGREVPVGQSAAHLRQVLQELALC